MDVPLCHNASVLLPISMVFFVNRFFGIRAETLGAPVIYLARESVTTGSAFHPRFATSGDLILGIVTEKQVGAGWIGNIHRVEPSFSAFVRHGLLSM